MKSHSIIEETRIIPTIRIVNSENRHVGQLRGNLQNEDANEILRLGVSIQQALWGSYRRAVVRKTAFIDDKIAAMWGCGGTFMGNVGIPWLLTSPEVRKISPLKFARIYQDEVMEMLKLFPKLENYCDANHHAAIRLLDIIGFSIEEPQKVGLGMYRKFWINL